LCRQQKLCSTSVLSSIAIMMTAICWLLIAVFLALPHHSSVTRFLTRQPDCHLLCSLQSCSLCLDQGLSVVCLRTCAVCLFACATLRREMQVGVLMYLMRHYALPWEVGIHQHMIRQLPRLTQSGLPKNSRVPRHSRQQWLQPPAQGVTKDVRRTERGTLWTPLFQRYPEFQYPSQQEMQACSK
jgi:hypothetical protein